jgi:pre-mRNA-splicing factor ISY1
MYKGIDPDYYGYRDEDDGVLVRKEAEAEKRAVEEAVAEFRAKRQRAAGQGEEEEEAAEEEDEEEALLARSLEQADGAAGPGVVLAGPASAATSAAVKAHVPVPSQEDIQKALVERKKQALLSQIGVA